MQVQRLESDVEQQTETAAKMATQLRFYRQYAVIVLNDGTDAYHTYTCPIFAANNGSFWIYNISAAEDKGYHPCTECFE